MGKRLTVAIDGPAGAGKSTVARAVAERLAYTLVDTGAIYRSVALLAARQGVAGTDGERLAAIVAELDLSFEAGAGRGRVLIGTEDVSQAIRAPAVSMLASEVAAQPVVRQGLLELQRRLAGRGGAVLEGRDIGTVVFPEAEVKIFLSATAEERATRRHAELMAAGREISLPEVLGEVNQRDRQDMERAAAPLRAADDAVVLDSTALTVSEVVERIITGDPPSWRLTTAA